MTADELDEDVGEISYTLDQYYAGSAGSSGVPDEELPPGLDGALTTIFEDVDRGPDDRRDLSTDAPRRPAAELIRRLGRVLPADIYRWTGHFPERTRRLLLHLADRAEELRQVYPENREPEAVIALTTLITALAMNHVHHGTYAP